MEKEMLKLFIYHMLTFGREGEKDFCLNGCIKQIDKTMDIIRKMSYNAWNEIMEKLPENHPALREQKKLMVLEQEQYEETLIKAKELMKKYSDSYTLDYDSLYLMHSEEDVDDLARKIIIKNKSTKEIKKQLEDKLEKEDTEKETVLLLYELSNCYYYGNDIKQDYLEAIKGWETIYKYSNDAKYMLAVCYMKGNGVKQDKKKAYEIFSELMNKDIIAKYRVAKFTFLGEGTEKNYEKALKIFSELKGQVPYDLNIVIDSYIGEMYFYGLGVEKDKEKGFELLENAWKSGFVKLNYENIKNVLQEYYCIQ